MPSEANAAVAARSHYPVRQGEPVAWDNRLFDSDGHEHQLIDLGAVQAVTKVSFAYVIWNRRDGTCVSHLENPADEPMKIGNAPLTDVQRHQRHVRALEALRTMYPEDDPRLGRLERAAQRGG